MCLLRSTHAYNACQLLHGIKKTYCFERISQGIFLKVEKNSGRLPESRALSAVFQTMSQEPPEQASSFEPCVSSSFS